jgi:hypothetical protein
MVCADAAENAEDALNEEWRLYQAAVGEVGQVIEVTHVITFEFKTGSHGAQAAHAALDLGERVRQNEIPGSFQIGPLPGMPPLGALFRRA